MRWSTSISTHTHTQGGSYSLSTSGFLPHSFSRPLDPHAFQIVFAKVKCNVQLGGYDGVNGEQEGGETNLTATNERRRLKCYTENVFLFLPTL